MNVWIYSGYYVLLISDIIGYNLILSNRDPFLKVKEGCVVVNSVGMVMLLLIQWFMGSCLPGM